MTGGRVMAIPFLLLAGMLIFGTPETRVAESLGDPGPALLPRIVGVLTGLLAVALWLQRSPTAGVTREARERAAVAVPALLAIPVFYLMFEHLGYTLAVGLYLLAAFSLLGFRNRASLVRYVLAATAFSLVSGLLFGRLLELPLPGVWP